MRVALRIGIALVVLLAVALGGLVVALPRIASSDTVRARLAAAARDATGREVTWEELSFGLLPPRLVVHKPRVGGPSEVAAEAVDLRLALLPLLARTVMVDSLMIDGANLRLVRTKEGIALPLATGSPSDTPTTAGEMPATGEGSSFAIAVGGVELRDSRLVLEDRAVAPPATWELLDLAARARGSTLEGPLDVSVATRLASGGHIRAGGTARLDGQLDLKATLESVALAPARAYLGSEALAGTLSGTLDIEGPAAAPTALTAHLVLDDARLALGTATLGGRLAAGAQLAGALAAPSGTVEVNVTDAALAYAGAFTKPPGTEASLAGRLVPGGDQLALEDVRLRLRNLEGQGKIGVGPRTRVELTAPAFALTGWDALVPAAAGLDLDGSLAIDHLTVTTAPLDVRGRLLLDGVHLRPGGPEPIRLDGALEGTGAAVRSKDMRATIARQTAALEVVLSDLAGTPAYGVGVRLEKADANALLTALAATPDTLYGPLDLTADLSGPLGGERAPLRTLRGQVRLDVGAGRLKGVSLLRGVVEQLGSFGEAALVLGKAKGGRDLQRFYEDEFRSISGTFALAGGSARTDDLRLVYRHYVVDLRGTLGLVGGALDLTGQLTIDESVDAAVAGTAPGQAAAGGRKKTIPLAHVRGTLSAPRIDLSPEAVATFASSFALGTQRPKLEREIDKHLGKGSGRQLLDTLEGILGEPRK